MSLDGRQTKIKTLILIMAGVLQCIFNIEDISVSDGMNMRLGDLFKNVNITKDPMLLKIKIN